MFNATKRVNFSVSGVLAYPDYGNTTDRKDKEDNFKLIALFMCIYKDIFNIKCNL